MDQVQPKHLLGHALMQFCRLGVVDEPVVHHVYSKPTVSSACSVNKKGSVPLVAAIFLPFKSF